jgi:hypothetical protein
VLSIKNLFGRSINKILKRDRPQGVIPKEPAKTYDDIIASITSQESVWLPEDEEAE